MTVDALIALRADIDRQLETRAADLRRQLEKLGAKAAPRANGSLRGRRSRKVAPKYRGPGGETWAGRGAKPRWMVAAMKQGKKPEDFLIAKPRKARGAAAK
jgi:DNA-binding protein H-NS